MKIQEEISIYKSIVNYDYKDLGINSGMLGGALKLVTAIKAGAPIVKSMAKEIGGLFGGQRTKIISQVVDLSEIKGYLNDIKNKLSEINYLNEEILESISELEEKILKKIDDSQNLDSRHNKLFDEISGLNKIDIDVLGKLLTGLSMFEYRPTKVLPIIEGYETYIAYYSNEYLNGKVDQKASSNPLMKILRDSISLEKNILLSTKENEINIFNLTNELILLHKIIFFDYPDAKVNDEIDYNLEDYGRFCDDLKKFQIKKIYDKKGFLEIYKRFLEIIRELENHQQTYNLFQENLKVINMYNSKLIQDLESIDIQKVYFVNKGNIDDVNLEYRAMLQTGGSVLHIKRGPIRNDYKTAKNDLKCLENYYPGHTGIVANKNTPMYKGDNADVFTEGKC